MIIIYLRIYIESLQLNLANNETRSSKYFLFFSMLYSIKLTYNIHKVKIHFFFTKALCQLILIYFVLYREVRVLSLNLWNIIIKVCKLIEIFHKHAFDYTIVLIIFRVNLEYVAIVVGKNPLIVIKIKRLDSILHFKLWFLRQLLESK